MHAQAQRFFYSPYFLVILAGLCFFLGLGSVPLFDLDEGAFTEATREMLESGVYAATYLDGEPRYDKPILFYWFQATSITLFGFNEWAMRLPSAIAASLWAWAIFCFVKDFKGLKQAQVAVSFMICCLWVGAISRAAIADALLNLFLTLTVFDIWRYLQRDSEGNQHSSGDNAANKRGERAIYRVYLWMALGTLTKGPIAVVVPVAVSLLYLISSRQLAKHWQAYFNFKAWFIYFATVVPWLVAVWYTQPGFFEGFLGDHNLSRFTATRESHGGSLLYYFGALPLIILPLTGLLFVTLYKIKTIWQGELSRYLLLWFFIIFCVFSFSKTQLPHYILNCCVPLFILMATVPNSDSKHQWSVVFGLAFIIALVFLPEILAIAARDSDGYDAAMLAPFESVIPASYRLVATIVMIFAIAASFLPKLATWQRLTVIGVLLNVLVFSQVVKIASDLQQKPIHSAIEFLEKHYPNEEVVAFKLHMPSFSVYRQRITPLRAPTENELALVRSDRLDQLENAITPLEFTVLHNYGGIVVLRASAVNP